MASLITTTKLSFSFLSLHHRTSTASATFRILSPRCRKFSDDLATRVAPEPRQARPRVTRSEPWEYDVSEKKKVVTTTTTKTTTTEVPRHSKAARRFFNQKFCEPPQRLAKVLAAAGVASRRSSEELIFERKVTVNGTVCDKPQTKVDPGKDVIYVNGNRLPKRLPPKVYLALNKPKGYICSAGEKESKSVLCLFDDFLKGWDKKNPGELKPRLFTVGRLDVATTGLIIVTNDGDFAQRVSHPSSNLTKEYIATVVTEVHKRHLVALSQGTTIDGVHCTPEYVELLPSQPDKSRDRLRIVVNEGRNHEVRELVKNAGLEIHSLKRTRIGGFRLATDLRIGKYVELKEHDLKALGWEKSRVGEVKLTKVPSTE